MTRVLARDSLVALIGGKSTRLEQGQEYDVPGQDAADLARAGYVELIDELIETATEPEPEQAVAPRQRKTSRRSKGL